MIKAINYDGWVFLTNSLGEETGKALIPEEVNVWYQKVSITNNPDWLEYLVQLNGQYGIALTQEIGHSGCDNNDEFGVAITEPSDSALNNTRRIAEAIEKRTGLELYIGNETGIFGRHELVVFVPVHTSMEDYDKIREGVLGLTGSVDNFSQM